VSRVLQGCPGLNNSEEKRNNGIHGIDGRHGNTQCFFRAFRLFRVFRCFFYDISDLKTFLMTKNEKNA
jgi:hypothetical protein